MTFEEFIAQFKAENPQHKTHDGRDAWRTIAPYPWFKLMCNGYGFKITHEEGALAEAECRKYTLTYCEGDVTLSTKEV